MSWKRGKKFGDQYDVGYGKPPVAGQFQKGQSGNPKGRHRRAEKPAIELLASVLEEPVNATVEGKIKRMSRQEFMIRSAVANGAKSPRDLNQLFSIMREYNLLAPREVIRHMEIVLVKANQDRFGRIIEQPPDDQTKSKK